MMSQLIEFLQMGGYAFYVWVSYGLCLFFLLLNMVLPLQREKQLMRTIAKRSRRVDPS